MNWKTDLKLSDLDPIQKIEIVCKRCNLPCIVTRAQLIARTGLGEHLYMDEVEYSLHAPMGSAVAVSTFRCCGNTRLKDGLVGCRKRVVQQLTNKRR